MLGNFGGEVILFSELATGSPFGYTSDGSFVHTLQCIFCGEAGTYDKHHDVIAPVKRVLLFNVGANILVRIPKLLDGRKVRIPGRLMLLDVMRILTGTVDQIPFRQRQIRLRLVPLVIGELRQPFDGVAAWGLRSW